VECVARPGIWEGSQPCSCCRGVYGFNLDLLLLLGKVNIGRKIKQAFSYSQRLSHHSNTMPQNRGGRNETHNFSSARNIAAFEALLEEEDDSDPNARGKKPKKNKRRSPKPDKPVPFQLREGASTGTGADEPMRPHAVQQSNKSAQQQLQELFGQVCDASVLQDVLAMCGGSMNDAIEALLAMGLSSSSIEDTSHESSSLQDTNQSTPHQPRTSLPKGAAGASTSHAPSPLESTSQEYHSPWSLLPVDLKRAVLAALPLKSLCIAASTCREFATYAEETRLNLHRLTVPSGLSYSTIMKAVQAFANADTLDLSRCLPQSLATSERPGKRLTAFSGTLPG